jgi:flagellar protein FliL
MAKKSKGDDEEGAKKKKPIVPIILLVGGLFAGKTFFGGGGAEKTAAELEAEEAAEHAELVKACQEANGMTEDGGHDTASTDHGTTDDAHSDPTETTSADHGDDHGGESLELVNIALVAASRPAQGGGGAASAVPSVLEMDPVTVNLADNHYLKLGLALQLKEGLTAEIAGKEGLGAKALDMALGVFSSKEMPDLIPAESRAAIKQQLGYDVCIAYHGEVTTVYFTEFVMQ